MWAAVLIIPRDKAGEVESVLEKICERDPSFGYARYANRLVVLDEDLNRLHRRAMWLYGRLGVKYFVAKALVEGGCVVGLEAVEKA